MTTLNLTNQCRNIHPVEDFANITSVWKLHQTRLIFKYSLAEKVGLLRVWSKQYPRSHDVEGIAAAHTICKLYQPIHRFGVGVGGPAVKVSEYFLSPVLHCYEQWPEGKQCIAWYPGLPLVVEMFCILPAVALPDVVELFFSLVGFLQDSEVAQPCAQNKQIFLIEVSFPFEQNKAVAHQLAPLFLCKAFSDAFSYRVKSIADHPKEVEFVNHHLRLWENRPHQVFVWLPHVHTDDFNSLLIGQVGKVFSNNSFLPVVDDVENTLFFDVSENSTIATGNFEFIDAQPSRRNDMAIFVSKNHVLMKHISDCLFMDADVFCQGGECSVEDFPLDISHQAFCHVVSVIHIRKRLNVAFPAILADVALSDGEDGNLFAVDWSIGEELAYSSVTIFEHEAAMRAAGGHNIISGCDFIAVHSFVHVVDCPVR